MKDTLGTASGVLWFRPEALYPVRSQLNYLEEPFSELEVERAIRHLAKKKSSGPNGVPNEFLQIYWQDIKEEIMTMVNYFYNHDLNISEINRANIIMIPKKEVPLVVQDFRPISVINVIPKLLSKLLATRLVGELDKLISIQQTTFIQGRHIAKNFTVTREILNHINSTKNSTVMVKIDFSKAFDTVNWLFLEDILIQRGFLVRWVEWVKELLYSASSRVVINGEASEYFENKQELRQGDPLSPMLFRLTVDVLQQMIGVANSTLSTSISSKIQDSILALQYVDDMALISNANTETLVTLKLILGLFQKSMGLR